jgi:hypothetical protein
MLPSQPTRIELKHEDSKELLAHRARHQEKQRAIIQSQSHNASAGGLSSAQQQQQQQPSAVATRIGVIGTTTSSSRLPVATSTSAQEISWR